MSKVFVTTSWDDGHVLDLRLAALLEKYQLAGTFYVAKNYLPEAERLTDAQIAELSGRFEMGAHTLTHPSLPSISADEAYREIKESKTWLESLTGREIPMFCYPRGKVNASVVELVRRAGFVGARTVQNWQIGRPSEPLLMGATVHVYPFPFGKKTAHQFDWRYFFRPLRQNWKGLRSLGIGFGSCTNWLSLATAAFDRAMERGGVFHVWGHSWEIEKYEMWDEVEKLFAHIAKRSGCIYGTNGESLSWVEST